MSSGPVVPEELRRGVKWARHPPDVLPLWVADMDLGTAPVIVDRLRWLLERVELGYPVEPRPAVADALLAWQSRRHGWTPEPDHVRLFVDVLQGVAAALRWGTEPGCGVGLLTPVYPPFLAAVERAGRRVVDLPLVGEGRRFDPAALGRAADAGMQALLLCNPHNPTGRVLDDDELAALADVVVERDLLLISDEIWADVVHPGARHVPMASRGPEVARRTVTLTSASKAFNLAGLRCAVGVLGPDRLRATIDDLPPHLLGDPNVFGVTALLTAWTQGEGWLEQARATLTARRDQLTDLLAREVPGVGYQPPQATYLAWLDLRAFDLGDDPSERLLRDGRIALSPGPDFGPGGAGHVRLNFATTPEVLADAVGRIASVLAARP